MNDQIDEESPVRVNQDTIRKRFWCLTRGCLIDMVPTMVARAVTAPLSAANTVAQVAAIEPTNSLVSEFRTISNPIAAYTGFGFLAELVRVHGVRALYRGCWVSVIRIPIAAACASSVKSILQWATEKLLGKPHPHYMVLPWIIARFIIAFLSGLSAAAAVYPLEYCKVLLVLDPSRLVYPTTRHALRMVYKSTFRGILTGFLTSFLCSIVWRLVLYQAVDTISAVDEKSFLRRWFGKWYSRVSQVLYVILPGFVAYPLDTMRRVQMARKATGSIRVASDTPIVRASRRVGLKVDVHIRGKNNLQIIRDQVVPYYAGTPVGCALVVLNAAIMKGIESLLVRVLPS